MGRNRPDPEPQRVQGRSDRKGKKEKEGEEGAAKQIERRKMNSRDNSEIGLNEVTKREGEALQGKRQENHPHVKT